MTIGTKTVISVINEAKLWQMNKVRGKWHSPLITSFPLTLKGVGVKQGSSHPTP